MITTENILQKIKDINAKIEKAEEQIKNISLIRDAIQHHTVKVQFRDSVGTTPFYISADFKERFADLVLTELTTQREQLICNAQELIGPTEHERRKRKRNC